ncbi:HD-GYP domain-containing protein [Clostridium sp. P21]|uniref:HD-GYP domain-containing protein n=1 Tax=Clostridium muellerianum TaxID=2716538 RepID=A0A7Y0EFV5_9CLOT|nr:HD-GYP domain-containing protein [Clostridium muellerianum]NMM62726.1 HD-GYP domain-containing protein [Clostridium muellerianum]
MRYVPVLCLKEGMKLGKSIYSTEGVVLLAEDVVLTEEYISSLVKIGVNGVYIDDSISSDIEVKNVISDELRIQAIKSIKSIYNNSSNIGRTINMVENIAKSIMFEILNSKNIMINMIDIKTFDDYMYTHCLNVGVLAAVVGVGLNLETKRIEKLTAAGLLHDIGKVFISKEVLNKTENLTKEEEKLIQSHSELGYKYIKQYYTIPVTSYVGVLQHHERFDGKGYPDGKKGEEISKFGRIICLCDAYDKLVTKTATTKACIPSEAIEYIMANNGQIFDPKLVKIFLRRVAPYPVGSILKLSNGERVIVIENNEECSIRPKVRNVETKEIYDLTYDWNLRNVTIVAVEDI